MFLTIESARLPCCTIFERFFLQQTGQLVDFLAKMFRKSRLLQEVIELIRQLNGERGEIIDEVERILDFVGDARGELAERCKLLGLHKTVLRGTEVVK